MIGAPPSGISNILLGINILEDTMVQQSVDGFLSDPGVPGVRSMGPDVTHSVSPRGFADLTDVTLADEDINSKPADDVDRAILGNVAMQVAPPGSQNWNLCK